METQNYYDDVVEPVNGHSSIGVQLAVLQGSLEKLGDRVTASQAETTRAVDQLRKDARWGLLMMILALVALAVGNVGLRWKGLDLQAGNIVSAAAAPPPAE